MGDREWQRAKRKKLRELKEREERKRTRRLLKKGDELNIIKAK